MLSAFLTGNEAGNTGNEEDNRNGGKASGLLGTTTSAGGDVLDLSGFGVASLDRQTETERAYFPLPAPSGQLIHDPDFSLPTTAGQLPWRLFHYSNEPDTEGTFGYGRRASWPLRLCAEQKPPEGSVITVLLEREDGLGAQYVSTNGGADYTSLSPRLFDTLTGDPTTGFVETRRDSGTAFHYPAGGFVSLSYFETVHGKAVTFHYDPTHQYLSSIVEPAGRTIDLSYNGDDYVESVADWASRVHSFTYDGGDLQTIVDPEGHVTTFASDGLHRLTGIMSPTGFVTSFTYDDNNRVKSRSLDGNAGTYDYLDGGQTVVYTDPYGKAWTTYLDGQGNVVKVVDPVGATRQATYNPKGQPTLLTDAMAQQTTLDYHPVSGHEIYRQEPHQAPHHWSVDNYGNVLAHTDPLGYVTTYSYVSALPGVLPTDAVQRLVARQQDPLGHFTTYTYRPWGALESVETPLGFITTHTWDDTNGLMTGEINPLGDSRQYQHDAAGNVKVDTDEEGRSVTYTYDGLGRQISSLNAIGALRLTSYDGVGNRTVDVDPLGHRTTYSYNAYNNETEEWDARGFRHTTLYDKKGRETGRIDPNNHHTANLYDDADRLTGRKDALNRVTTFGYDAARRVVAMTEPAGVIHRTIYDLVDSATGLPAIADVAPNLLRTTSVYDLTGNRIAVVDTTGLRTSFGFDALNRPQSVQEPTGGITTTVYDPNGRISETIDALGHRVSTSYDPLNMPLLTVDSGGRQYTASYDRSSAVTFEAFPDGTTQQHSYDPVGRHEATVDHLNLRVTLAYNSRDQVISHTDIYGNATLFDHDPVGLPTGMTDVLGNVHTTVFDDAGRPINYLSPTGNVATFAYNAADDVTQFNAGMDHQETYDYDDFGRLHAVANAFDHRTSISYDVFGRHSATIAPDNGIVTRLYDDFGRHFGIQDALDNKTYLGFDPYGRAVSVTDPEGHTETVTPDVLGRTINYVSPRGFVATYHYDALDRVTLAYDLAGGTHAFEYDSAGNLKAFTDPLKFRTTYGYDTFSRLVTVIDARNKVSQTDYDPFDRLSAQTNERGFTQTWTYDAFGRPETQIDPHGQHIGVAYDPFGRQHGFWNELGHRSSLTFDLLDRVIVHKDPTGAESAIGYDAVGRVQRQADPLNNATLFHYDRVGRLMATTDPMGYRVSTIHDKAGNPIVEVDARGNRTTYSYDGRGLPKEIKDASGFVTSFTFDADGDMREVIDAKSERTTYTNDPMGRVQARNDANSYLWTTMYDAYGQPTKWLDPLGRVTTNSYDALGNQIAVAYPNGDSSYFAYDEVGNLLTATNGLGHITSFQHDALDQLTVTVDPLGRQRLFDYDAAGRLVTETYATGQTTVRSYDKRDYVIGEAHSDGRQVAFQYDAAGRCTLAYDSSTGHSTFTYDGMGRVLSVHRPEHPQGLPITYSYDESGNQAGLGSGWNGVFSYVYDEQNRMQAVYDPGYAATGVSGGGTSFTYDEVGLRVRQHNGVSGTVTTWAYDALGRTQQIRHSAVIAEAEYDHASYVYDPAGRPLYKSTARTQHTYSYDALDRVRDEATAYPQAFVVNSGGGTSLVYDARQNFRYDASATSANGSWHYGWSATLTADFVLDSGPASSSATGGATGVFGYESVATNPYGLPVILANDGPNDPATFYSISLPRNTLLLHPGDNSNYAVLRFVAPYPGVYTFDGVFSSLDSSTTTDVHIQRASTKTDLFSAVQNTSTPHPFSLAGVQLGYGEAIDFRVGDGGNSYGSDATGLTVQVTASPVWNAVSDFTLTSNPGTGGAWSYGSTPSLGGAFSPFTGSAMDYLSTPGLAAYYTVGPQYDLPFLLANKTSPPTTLTYYGTIVQPPDVLDLHTGSGGVYCVLRFTAQKSGTYHVAGYFDGLENGGATATDVHVLKNGTQNIWGGSHSVSGYGPSSVQAFNLSGVHLSVGDTVDFCVGEGTGGYLSDPTGLAVTIAATAFDGSGTAVALPGYQRTTWTYDAAGRIDQEVSDWLVEMGAMDTATTPYVYDPADQLLSFGTGSDVTDCAYDENGNTLWRRQPDGSVVTYAWDTAGRLTQITQPNGDVYQQRYRYDGLRVGQTLLPGIGGSPIISTFVWDGDNLHYWERSGGGTTAEPGTQQRQWFVRGGSGGNENSLLRAFGTSDAEGALQRSYYLDALGSVQAVSHPASGGGSTLTYYSGLDAFGATLPTVSEEEDASDGANETWDGTSGAPAPLGNPYDFIGGLGYWREPDLGLLYVGQRWYDPSTRQWLSVDPMSGYPNENAPDSSEPRYLYANNAPTLFVDPTGGQTASGGTSGQSPSVRYTPEELATLRWAHISPNDPVMQRIFGQLHEKHIHYKDFQNPQVKQLWPSLWNRKILSETGDPALAFDAANKSRRAMGLPQRVMAGGAPTSRHDPLFGLEFTAEGVGKGFQTGLVATTDVLTFHHLQQLSGGRINPDRFANEPGYRQSVILATIGREAALSAIPFEKVLVGGARAVAATRAGRAIVATRGAQVALRTGRVLHALPGEVGTRAVRAIGASRAGVAVRSSVEVVGRDLSRRLQGGGGFGISGAYERPRGPEIGRLKALYVKAAKSPAFRAGLTVQNALVYARTLGKSGWVTSEEIVNALKHDTVYRMQTLPGEMGPFQEFVRKEAPQKFSDTFKRIPRVGISRISEGGEKYLVGGLTRGGAGWQYLYQSGARHEILHLAQYIRAAKMGKMATVDALEHAEGGWAYFKRFVLYEIGPSALGSPETHVVGFGTIVYGGVRLLIPVLTAIERPILDYGSDMYDRMQNKSDNH